MHEKIEELILEKLTSLEKNTNNIDKRLSLIEVQMEQDKKEIKEINSIINSKAFIVAMDSFYHHAGDIKEIINILSRSYNSKTGYEVFLNVIENYSDKFVRNTFIKKEFFKQIISKIIQGILIALGIIISIIFLKK